MKQTLMLLVLVIFCISAIYGQKVDGIKAEQSGDFIKISYKILNSTPSQIFRVRILFSENGGLNQEIKTISGDIGDQVAGGKEEYWALWDVLKDKEQVQSLEFVVRAELVKDLSKNQINEHAKQKGSIYVMGSMEGDMDITFGVQAGYMAKWGALARANFGNKRFDLDAAQGEYPAYSLGFYLTKSLVIKDKFQLHLFAGPGFSKLARADSFNNETSTYLTIGGGFMISVWRIALSFDVTKVNGDPESGGGCAHLGFGIRF